MARAGWLLLAADLWARGLPTSAILDQIAEQTGTVVEEGPFRRQRAARPDLFAIRTEAEVRASKSFAASNRRHEVR